METSPTDISRGDQDGIARARTAFCRLRIRFVAPHSLLLHTYQPDPIVRKSRSSGIDLINTLVGWQIEQVRIKKSRSKLFFFLFVSDGLQFDNYSPSGYNLGLSCHKQNLILKFLYFYSNVNFYYKSIKSFNV